MMYNPFWQQQAAVANQQIHMQAALGQNTAAAGQQEYMLGAATGNFGMMMEGQQRMMAGQQAMAGAQFAHAHLQHTIAAKVWEEQANWQAQWTAMMEKAALCGGSSYSSSSSSSSKYGKDDDEDDDDKEDAKKKVLDFGKALWKEVPSDQKSAMKSWAKKEALSGAHWLLSQIFH